MEEREMMAANGHLMVYTVLGYDRAGYPIYSQWDASHSLKCRCWDSDEETEY